MDRGASQGFSAGSGVFLLVLGPRFPGWRLYSGNGGLLGAYSFSRISKGIGGRKNCGFSGEALRVDTVVRSTIYIYTYVVSLSDHRYPWRYGKNWGIYYGCIVVWSSLTKDG